MSKLKKVLNDLVNARGRGTKAKLAKFLNISPVHITRYLSHEDEYQNLNMPSKYFKKVAEFFDVDPLILYEADERVSGFSSIISSIRIKDSAKNTVNLPIIEALAGCGASGMLDQLKLTEDKMSVDRRIFPPSMPTDNLALIRVVGDSMEPYLEENDWAVIQLKKDLNIVYVNAVYLIAHGDSVQIKRCAFQADGSCALLSDNKNYPPETALAGDWEVVGKVVARIKIGSPMLAN